MYWPYTTTVPSGQFLETWPICVDATRKITALSVEQNVSS